MAEVERLANKRDFLKAKILEIQGKNEELRA
jgi:hypothetical protein